jgi:sugar lactone lactonase YvrE
MDTVMTGLGLLESPRWHAGRLWVADWTAGLICTIDPSKQVECQVQIVVEHQSLPMCFDFLPDAPAERGLVLTSSSERALLRLSVDGTLRRYADLSVLSPHGPNDIVIDGRGNTYVNNVNFDFAAGPPAGDPAPGFVALVKDGCARVVADDLAFPNGMAVTADNATLIVTESYRHRLTAFDIGADGSLSNRRVWADVGDHSPDGICLDRDGAAWYADVGAGCCVRVREGGEVLDRLQLDRGAFACMLGGLGGNDGSTLFVVAAHWPGPQRSLVHHSVCR